MPYIRPEDRPRFDNEIDALVEEVLVAGDITPGEVNYVMYTFLLRLFKAIPKYRTINIIDGALDDVGKELYRRHFGPYEDQAIKRNGDIT
jgi:hypothetical protein